MPRHEIYGHKAPLSPDQYVAMTALLTADSSRHAVRNRALLAIWWDSLLRVEDVCGLSVGTVAGKSTFTVAQGKVSIASAILGRRKKRTVTVYLQPRTVELVAAYLATAGKGPDDPLFSAQGRNDWTVYNRKSTKGVEYQTRVGISAEQVRQLFKGWCAAIGLDASVYSTHSIRRIPDHGNVPKGSSHQVRHAAGRSCRRPIHHRL